MGNKLCDWDGTAHKQGIQGSQLITNGVKLDCVICKKEFPPVEFNRHLDVSHFLAIRDRTTGITCECIICGEDSFSIERHQEHLKSCHFQLDDEISSPQQRVVADSNSDLKSKITEIRLEEIAGLTFTGSLENKHKIYRGTYSGMQYKIVELERREDIGLAERYNLSNLVWKPIFTEYLRTSYYAVCRQEGRAVRSYLLMELD